jgi:hypothetical protein
LTRPRACGELRRELGVYVLGAIAPADRSAVEFHLSTCAGCRDQLANLAGLPALLRRVSLDEVHSLGEAGGANDGGAQPHRQLASLLSQVAKRKRYRIWSQLVAAAAAVFALAAAAGYGVLGTSSRQLASSPLPGSMTVRGSNPQTGATAVVTYAGRPWGVQLYVQVKGIAAGTHCVLEVTDSGGHESEAANWTVARGDETARYMASSSFPVTRLRGFVVTAKGLALVRVDATVPRPRIAGPR